MKAVYISEPGGPEVLEVREVEAPVPGKGEVLIDVVAAGLNRADVQQRRGFYPPPPGASDIPGLEVSGRIAGFGPGVTRAFSLGDKVVALLAGGGYAQQVAVPAEQVLRVPDNVDLVTAAALPEVAATVYSNLFLEAGLAAGDTVLIHGGAGGIGTMATQLVAATGAHPIVTAGSPEKLEYCRGFGAEAGIDYRTEDFVDRILELTAGQGADIVLDVIGAKYLERNVRALAVGGRLVVIGLQGGAKAELDLGALMSRRARVIGTTLRSRPAAEKARIVAGTVERVWPLVDSGAVRVAVERTFPLEQVARAHEFFDSGEHRGKLLLTL
jgi:putative PIG3 family NAD(P)H quinone oxidoreductase